jgi:hypothetical protein
VKKQTGLVVPFIAIVVFAVSLNLLFPYIVYVCAKQRWRALAGFVAVQVLGNLHPMLHLRWVRVNAD